MIGWWGRGKYPFQEAPHCAKGSKGHKSNFLGFISSIFSLLCYSDQFCGTAVKVTEAEIGSDASSLPRTHSRSDQSFRLTPLCLYNPSHPWQKWVPPALSNVTNVPLKWGSKVRYHLPQRRGGPLYLLLPPHSSHEHLDSSLFLMVGHGYLVDHSIPTDCSQPTRRWG